MTDSQPSQVGGTENQSEPMADNYSEKMTGEPILPNEASQIPATVQPLSPPPDQKSPDSQKAIKKTNHKKKRGSLFFPLLLIAVGLFLLLSNLNFIPGSTWEILLKLWPVLFIVWGLDTIWREEGLTGAIFLLGLGVVFLLGNFGYLQLNPWQVLLVIWPVLLVAIGFDILISRHRTWWANLLGLILVIGLMVGALWLAGAGLPDQFVASQETVRYDLQGASQAEIQLSPATGEIELGGMINPELLIEGTIPASTSTQQIQQQFVLENNKATLLIRSTGMQGGYPSPQSMASWKLALTPMIPLDLGVSIGGGNGMLDLTGLQVEDLEFNMGIGQVKIVLPSEGKFDASIEGAIGQVIIIVPEGMSVRLESDTFLVGKSLPEDYQKSGNVYTSQNFGQDDNQVNLNVGVVFGQVIIQEK